MIERNHCPRLLLEALHTLRIRDNDRPEAARRAHARQFRRARPTRPLRIDPLNNR